jgi:hypothetical protein
MAHVSDVSLASNLRTDAGITHQERSSAPHCKQLQSIATVSYSRKARFRSLNFEGVLYRVKRWKVDFWAADRAADLVQYRRYLIKGGARWRLAS